VGVRHPRAQAEAPGAVWCRLRMSNHCKNGIVLGGGGQEIVWDGAFAEYVVAPGEIV